MVAKASANDIELNKPSAIAGVHVPYLLFGLALYGVAKSYDSPHKAKVGIPENISP